MEYSSKRKNPLYATWTDLEYIMLSEISQTQKDKHFMIPLMWSILNFQTDRELNGGCQEMGWGRVFAPQWV